MSQRTSRQLHIWPEESKRQDDSLKVNARIELQNTSSESLWYRLPIAHQTGIAVSADPFLIGTIFLAMRRATVVRVHGRVSPSLLRNLEEFQAAWHCWNPDRYHRVEIQADTEMEEESAQGDRTAMMFSGGLDSCFTAWRHMRGDCGRRRRHLEAAIMVHGFDIPLDEPEVFQRAAENSRQLAASIGLELIPIACNFRQFDDDWEEAHGAALASCLHLLRKSFATGLIAGSHVYNALRFPWGSNPLTDGLLSSASLAVVYDGAEFSRREKARAVAVWSEAMARVRVCWQGTHKDRNCGTCQRCVGTAICFVVEGRQIPSSLPIKSLADAIRGMDATNLKPVTVTRLAELLEAARTSKINEAWVTALEECVSRPRLATTKGITRKLRAGFRQFFSPSARSGSHKPSNGGSL